MVKGEFIRGDGLVIPNNVTLAGALVILRAAFQGTPIEVKLGLCNAVFSPTLQVSQIERPAAANGYAEIPLITGPTDWPVTAVVNGVYFIESRPVVFTPTGAGFDKAVSRMYLGLDTGAVFSLGGLLPQPTRFTPATPEDFRTFRYRLYLG